MLWTHFFLALVFAFILTGILVWAVGWRHPRGSSAVGPSILFLFIILLFSMWAGTAWLPGGEVGTYGTPWLGTLLIGLLIGLLILAIAAPAGRNPRTPREASERAAETAVAGTVLGIFGIFFWLLIIGLFISVLVRYVG